MTPDFDILCKMCKVDRPDDLPASLLATYQLMRSHLHVCGATVIPPAVLALMVSLNRDVTTNKPVKAPVKL